MRPPYHPAVLPLPILLLLLGALALGVGVLVLRSFGPGYRIGRILAGTPTVTIGEAVGLARAGSTRTVRVQGRIDAADEFEDDAHRPLVLRRVRLLARRASGWETIDDTTRSVPFALSEELDTIGVDLAALEGGLVVVPRVSEGTAGDAPGSIPGELPAETPIRLLIEQISSVEHATAVGRPALGPDGSPVLTGAGADPLYLSTLENDEAMRILAGGSRLRPLAVAVSFLAGSILLALGIALALLGAITGAIVG